MNLTFKRINFLKLKAYDKKLYDGFSKLEKMEYAALLHLNN